MMNSDTSVEFSVFAWNEFDKIHEKYHRSIHFLGIPGGALPEKIAIAIVYEDGVQYFSAIGRAVFGSKHSAFSMKLAPIRPHNRHSFFLERWINTLVYKVIILNMILVLFVLLVSFNPKIIYHEKGFSIINCIIYGLCNPCSDSVLCADSNCRGEG